MGLAACVRNAPRYRRMASALVAVAIATCANASDATMIGTGLSPPIAGPVCSIASFGAVGDNATLNTAAIQAAIDHCAAAHPAGSTVLVPAGAYRTASISLRHSNMRFHLAAGAGLYGSTDPSDYTISLQWFGGHLAHNFDALLRATNASNVSITGSNTFIGPSSDLTRASIVDGVGWKWWCQNGVGPLMKKYHKTRFWCDEVNPDNSTLPTQLLPEPRGQGRPRLVDVYNCSGVVLLGLTVQNSPHWSVHLQYSRDVLVQNVTVLTPRSVGNTDGIDPDSTIDTLITDSYISVGDDGISIKSDNITTEDGRRVMMPTRNLTMRRLVIRSRNWCIGSSTFGGIYDILFEDSVIGDPSDAKGGVVPWAFKFKSHEYYPGSIANVTVRRVRVAAVGPTPWMYPNDGRTKFGAFQLGLTYAGVPKQRSGTPFVTNVTFEDIYVDSAGFPGAVEGLPESCFDQLTFRNVTFGATINASVWKCANVQASSFRHDGVDPPFSGCTNNNTKGTCA